MARDDPTECISFNEPKDFFEMSENYNAFVKDCESMCRRHEDYKHYVDYVERIVGLDFCQVNPNIHKDDATIEMHHGPIFTLYDYCEIILDYYLNHHWKITTFRIADDVLKEHWANHIQVVMLSTSIHQEVHDREIFININQAWGDLASFLKKYPLNKDLKEKYNRYLDKCQMMDSTSYEILKLNEKLINRDE